MSGNRCAGKWAGWMGIGLVLAVLLAPGAETSMRAAEIGFIEEFSLAEDRTVPLKQLIPGTEDYYYYHVLHYQHSEQWDLAEEMLKTWIARYKHTPRVYEMLNRQRLLTYHRTPELTLQWLRERLDLRFDHQRELLNQRPNLPTSLAPELLTEERLRANALAIHSQTLQGFEETALERLAAGELTPQQRRELLSRLTRPDLPNLIELIVADLNFENSGGFGQFPIHGRLLLSQLEELLKRKPELLNEVNFVHTYIRKLRPDNDVNWRQDQVALGAYLERLWEFVQRLQPVHNSLKAHVLYHRLLLDRAKGVYDADKFLLYIQLPRHAPYLEPKFMEREESRRFPADLNADFSSVTLLPAIHNDEALVRSYLQEIFLEADDYRIYVPFIRDDYLKRLFAETKIVNGLGDPERWYALLSPEDYQALKNRIDLDFAFTNKTEFASDEPVTLDVYVKNVPTLLVKVFEINTQNYYREHLEEINTDINLDGLIANTELTFKYTEPPLRRVRRQFKFPSLDHRGVYVIDFIGNGISSRALIRKGKLRALVRTTTAGQLFQVFDDQNQLVTNASLWLGGTLYQPLRKPEGKETEENKETEPDGTILTPFSNQPGRQPVVLTQGGFSSLDHFYQEGEQYELVAGIYVDREELLTRRTARVVLRPQLLLNGRPVSLELLEEVRLVITSQDLDGVGTTKEVPNFKLFADRETTFEFLVPQRLASLTCRLQAKVKQLSQNQKIDLAVSQSFSINEIDRTDKIEDLHLLQIEGAYVIDLLGKTGESQPHRPVQISLKPRDYRDAVNVVLQTDPLGRIVLGPLPGVATCTATGPNGVSHTWTIEREQHTYPQTVHAAVGEPVLIPYMGTAEKPQREELSLLELRGDDFAIDRFAALKIRNSLLEIKGLPAGDYSLVIKPLGVSIRIRVAAGSRHEEFVLGRDRRLEVINPKPLQLAPIVVEDDKIRLQLVNAGPLTRVHLLATRFRPAFPAYASLAAVRVAEPSWMTTPRADSLYIAGRNIGDEYRYILDRRFQQKFPGNMLERPSLLLNPWAIRSTSTGEQLAAEGQEFGAEKKPGDGENNRPESKSAAPSGLADFANLDFLIATSLVLTNLEPDDEGRIEILRADLGPHQDLLVIAVDLENTVRRNVTLPEPKPQYADLRLAKIFDVKRHFTQQKKITSLAAGGQLNLPDITSTRFEAYDNLGRVYGLYATLNPQPHLLEFGFILQWPTLKPEEKKDRYSKYASHELNFFLARKDPEFFRTVVQPYLANKKDQTFMDEFLLGRDLAAYRKPWNFARLNTVERILLAQRIEAERQATARFVREQWELLPPDPDRFLRLFGTALEGSALETNDALGLILRQRQDAVSQQERRLTDEMEVTNGVLPALDAPAEPGAPQNRDKAAEFKKSGAKELAKRQADDDVSESRRRAGGRAGKDEKADAKQYRQLGNLRSERLAEQYYRKLDTTMEWAENNYYHLLIEQQDEGLVTANAFWRDYAAHDPAQPFFSVNYPEASRNFTEMMFALAVLDLPFTPAEHQTTFDGPQMTFTAGGPVILFHQEIREAKKVVGQTPILVSQDFFRQDDRFRMVGSERQDRFVAEEFLVDVVYGAQIVVTNPTSTQRKLDLLLQIPKGSLPVLNGQATKSVAIDLQPYHTQTVEYYFYFPAAGDYPHYPVQVAAAEEVLAFAAPFVFHVVSEPTNIDKTSWEYLSQHGSEADVLTYLKEQNLLQVNLERIAFRMRDKEFFQTVVALLAARHVYQQTLWSYSVLHNEVEAIREYLQHADQFVAQTGDLLVSPLLTIDPVARKTYQHLDYKPLVNPRVNQLGRHRQILNDRFFEQYHRLLKVLSYRRSLNDEELMSVTYYMLLQDRIAEAIAFYERVQPDALDSRLQYDYFTAYLDFSRAEPERAQAIAVKYQDYPVDRWRLAFANVVSQAQEILNNKTQILDQEDRNQIQTAQAAASPAFDFTVVGRQVKINHQNLGEVRVNYYLMDVELLFSRNPFVQGQSRQFSSILPNVTQTIPLPKDQPAFALALPEELQNRNLLVEIEAAGRTESQPYYANALAVQTLENFGQVRVQLQADGAALPRAYVKVYARMNDGSVRFYKDGYTDLRGRFDYASLNTNELEQVDRFSLLILSDEHGAVVRECQPPKR